MMKTRMTMATMAWMGAAVMMLAADAAMAQAASKDEPKGQTGMAPIPATLPKRVRSVRKSVIDLDAMAKDRRPGQVMPGDPGPMGGVSMMRVRGETGVPSAGVETNVSKPVTAASLEQNATKPTIKLPDTAPYTKPVLKPVGDSAARPEVLGGAMPAPEAAGVPETVVVETPVVERAPVVAAAEVAPAVEAAPISAPVITAPVIAAPVIAAPVIAAPAERVAVAVVTAPVVERVEPKVAEKAIERTPVAGGALVDGVVMAQLPSALSTGGASVRVESITGDGAGVQWRIGDGPWTTPTVGQTAEGKIEVRAGLDAQVVLVVDGLAQLRVTRLGRATIERCTEARGATSVGVGVTRGAVEVRPVGAAAGSSPQMFARVRTPDQVFGLTGAMRVEYDAFSGTRRRVVNP